MGERIYLAARYSRANELRGYADQLRALGETITSRWLYGDYPTDENGRSLEADMETRGRVAKEDMHDVLSANIVICFTEEPRSGGRGGRHVEMGVALGSQRTCIVIGPRENVFCCHPAVDYFETWDAFFAAYSSACVI